MDSESDGGKYNEMNTVEEDLESLEEFEEHGGSEGSE